MASAVSRTLRKLAILLLVFLLSQKSALAQRSPDPAKGEIVGGTLTIKGIEYLLENVLTVVLAFSGIVLFVMFLIGGFKYLTGGGDPKATESARATLTHAVIGLFILVISFIILQLIEVITGVKLSTFTIYRP